MRYKSWMILVVFVLALFSATAFETEIFNMDCSKSIITIDSVNGIDKSNLMFMPCRPMNEMSYECDCPSVRLTTLGAGNITGDFQFRMVVDYLKQDKVASFAEMVSVVSNGESIIEPASLPEGWVPLLIAPVPVIEPTTPTTPTGTTTIEKKDWLAWTIPIKIWFAEFEWKKEYTYLLLVVIIIFVLFLLNKKRNGKKELPVPAIPKYVAPPSQVVQPSTGTGYVPVGAKPVRNKVYIGAKGFKLEKEYEVTWEKVKE